MLKRICIVWGCLMFLLFSFSSVFCELTKEISYKHGVSENGNLQTFQVVIIKKDGEVISQSIGKPYTPTDYDNMAGYDQRSKDIAEAIRVQKVMDDATKLLVDASSVSTGDEIFVGVRYHI